MEEARKMALKIARQRGKHFKMTKLAVKKNGGLNMEIKLCDGLRGSLF